jgi:hypothetical protein
VRNIGLVLVVLGILALVYGGIGYNRRTTLFSVGGLKATATEHKTIPLAPVGGVIVLVGGLVLLTLAKRRLA